MYDRRDEIGIMKMVGATNRFIRFPYVIEGFLIGIIAATLAFFIDWGIYNLIANQIQNVDALKLFEIVSFKDRLLLPMVATFGFAGLFVGVFGSVMSIRKFLDV
jgi:cell division transport system permease protein